MDPEILKCGNCNVVCSKPLRCSVCKRMHYCNATCQKEDWKFHKRTCTKDPPPQQRSSALERAPPKKHTGVFNWGAVDPVEAERGERFKEALQLLAFTTRSSSVLKPHFDRMWAFLEQAVPLWLDDRELLMHKKKEMVTFSEARDRLSSASVALSSISIDGDPGQLPKLLAFIASFFTNLLSNVMTRKHLQIPSVDRFVEEFMRSEEGDIPLSAQRCLEYKHWPNWEDDAPIPSCLADLVAPPDMHVTSWADAGQVDRSGGLLFWKCSSWRYAKLYAENGDPTKEAEDVALLLAASPHPDAQIADGDS